MGFSQDHVYRLLSSEKWEEANKLGYLPYAPVDEKDGFFHLSSSEQVLETARLHYGKYADIVAAGIPIGQIGDELKWELSRGGQLFPHFYGQVKTALIDHLVHLQKSGEGYKILSVEELL